MPSITFLGTGSFLAPGRYWNSFVIDRRILVEPSPSALPNLRRAGLGVKDLDAVVISHFHPDHTFGWPFLALEILHKGRDTPLHVVGPPGVADFLAAMMHLGAVDTVHKDLHARIDVRYVEVDGTPQHAGEALAFQAYEVIHAPRLTCFGYVLDVDGTRIGYSGDTEPCHGLEQIASSCDVLILECAEVHRTPTHMDAEAVADLAGRHPGLRILLTHLGEGVAECGIAGVELPDDLDTLDVP